MSVCWCGDLSPLPPTSLNSQPTVPLNPRPLFAPMNTTEGAVVYSVPQNSIVTWAWQLLDPDGSVQTVANATYLNKTSAALSSTTTNTFTGSGLQPVKVACTPYVGRPRAPLPSSLLAPRASTAFTFNNVTYDYWWARQETSTGCVRMRVWHNGFPAGQAVLEVFG